MKTIVVPTDFSPSADNAAYYAAQVAKKTGASVLLLHVYQMPVSMNEVPVMMIPAEELKAYADSALAKAKEDFAKKFPDVTVITESRLGNVIDEINDACTKLNVFAVVMGKQGTSGIEKFIVGSTALSVVRHCTHPVITVPAFFTNRKIEKIAFATDLDEPVLLLPKISAFVKQLSASLHVIHVRIKKETASAEALTNLFSELQPVFHLIDEPNFFHGIQSYVHKNNIDMLIILPHKHSLLERIFFKTHTTELVEELDIPIVSFNE